jgi:hypothetical protein
MGDKRLAVCLIVRGINETSEVVGAFGVRQLFDASALGKHLIVELQIGLSNECSGHVSKAVSFIRLRYFAREFVRVYSQRPRKRLCRWWLIGREV